MKMGPAEAKGAAPCRFVAIVDDDESVPREVRNHMQRAGQVCYVSSYWKGSEVLHAVSISPPDLVVLKQTLPDGCGLMWAAKLKNCRPGVAVVIHAADACPENLIRALSLGVTGYLVANGEAIDWAFHLRQAMDGLFTMCPQTARLLPQAFTRLIHDDPWGLTRQEHQVMLGLCRKKTAKDMSTILGLATSTVQVHLKHAFKKLQVHDRRAAVEKYLLRR